jgi:glycosyltransferase involved in cell wall biosynthesis
VHLDSFEDRKIVVADPSKAIETKTFAVIIPLYNHERYIGAAIDSVLSQTRRVDEVIVIDDGSSDNGFEIASARLIGHTGARVWRQSNAGAHVAINRGIEAADSKYVAILNSDDTFHPDKIARCEEIFHAQENLDLLIGGVKIIDDAGVAISRGPTIDWLGRAHRFFNVTGLIGLSLLHENFAVTTSNMVFRKTLWRANSGFQELRYCHDLDFIMASMLNGRIHYDSAEYISYRVHGTNTIKDNISKIRVEIAAVLANAFREYGHVLTGAGNTSAEIAALFELIRTKDISDLALLLSAMRPRYADRGAFYKAVTTSEQIGFHLQVLQGSLPLPTQSVSSEPALINTASTEEVRPIRLVDGPPSVKAPALTVAIELGSFDKGGLEKVVLDSAIVFKQRGIVPIIVSVGPVGHLGMVAASHGVEVIQLPASSRDVFYSALLRVRNVKLTMSHFSRVGYPIFRNLRIPNITFIHNVYAMLAGDALAHFKADDHLVGSYISVSPKATRYASQKLGVDGAKIITIPNGLILDEHLMRDQAASLVDRAQFGLQPSDYVFLNVASYNLHKAHYLMAQAMELIGRTRSDIKIVCVGNEIYPPHVRQLRDHIKARGLERLMLLPGFFADVAPFHKMADAFILPSFIEGWSIAMNEAMFYEKPMILSDTGGSSEVIQNEDIGIVVPNEYGDVINLDAKLLDELAYEPKDYLTAPNLAQAMLRFANERQKWAAAGRLGRSKVVSQYDFSNTVDRYLEVIHNAVDA